MSTLLITTPWLAVPPINRTELVAEVPEVREKGEGLLAIDMICRFAK
jgi:hypothetical protein